MSKQRVVLPPDDFDYKKAYQLEVEEHSKLAREMRVLKRRLEAAEKVCDEHNEGEETKPCYCKAHVEWRRLATGEGGGG